MDETYPPGREPGHPQCANHPGTEAVARCVSCGKLVCAYCRVVLGNRNYCQACAAAGAQGYPPPQAVQPQGPWTGGPQGYPPPPGGTYPPPPPGAYPPTQGQPPPGAYYGYGYPGYPLPQALPQRGARETVFPGAPWGIGEAILIFVLSYVAAIVFILGLHQVLKQTMSGNTLSFMMIFLESVILYSFLLAGTFYSVKIRHGSTLTALGIKLDNLGSGFLIGIGLGLPLFITAIVANAPWQALWRNVKTPDVVTKSVTRVSSGDVGAGLIFLLVVTLVVLAPVCEETFFRGYFYPALRNRMDRWPAMLLNGFLFSLVHLEILGFIARWVLGSGLCYLYESKRNLSAPIAGHALYNGFVLLVQVFAHYL
jgi:CAAX protease family protein